MIQLIKKEDLQKGYRGLAVTQNPIKHEEKTYNLEVQIPKALMKQYVEYVERLLKNGYKHKNDQRHRTELESIVTQYHAGKPIIYAEGEANFRFKHFMEHQKGRSIEGLKGYGDSHYYRIK